MRSISILRRRSLKAHSITSRSFRYVVARKAACVHTLPAGGAAQLASGARRIRRGGAHAAPAVQLESKDCFGDFP